MSLPPVTHPPQQHPGSNTPASIPRHGLAGLFGRDGGVVQTSKLRQNAQDVGAWEELRWHSDSDACGLYGGFP